jgi:hypothetical protein
VVIHPQKIQSKTMYKLGVNEFLSSTSKRLYYGIVCAFGFKLWKYLFKMTTIITCINMFCIPSSTFHHQHCMKLTCIHPIIIENGNRDKFVKWMAFDKFEWNWKHGGLLMIASNLRVAILTTIAYHLNLQLNRFQFLMKFWYKGFTTTWWFSFEI